MRSVLLTEQVSVKVSFSPSCPNMVSLNLWFRNHIGATYGSAAATHAYTQLVHFRINFSHNCKCTHNAALVYISVETMQDMASAMFV